MYHFFLMTSSLMYFVYIRIKFTLILQEDEKSFGEFKQLILMNYDIPDRCRYKSMNNSITFNFPTDCLSGKRKAFIVPCVKFQSNTGHTRCWLHCTVFVNDIEVWCRMLMPRSDILCLDLK